MAGNTPGLVGPDYRSSAMLLQAGGYDDTESFVAVAQSLLDGRALRKIPIMLGVHNQTIAAWLYGGEAEDAFDPEIELQVLGDGDDLPLPPAPEQKGELGKLLRGTELSPGFIDGYLAAICIAPKMITPDRWVTPVLNTALPALPEPKLQRFLDVLLHRYNAALVELADSKAFQRTFKTMGSRGQLDWCEGFLEGQKTFKTSWPAKTLGSSDRAMLRQIEGMANDSTVATSVIPALASWLSGRLDMALE